MQVFKENPRIPYCLRPIDLLLTNIREDGPYLLVFLQLREEIGVSGPSEVTRFLKLYDRFPRIHCIVTQANLGVLERGETSSSIAG